MAKFVFKNAHLTVNSIDLTIYVESLTINYSADTPEKTAMGDGTRTRLPGLLDWSIDVTFRQDFANALVDSTLFSLVGAAAFPIIVRPDVAAKGAGNPEFTGNALLSTYSPMGNTVGDVAAAPITMVADGALARGV